MSEKLESLEFNHQGLALEVAPKHCWTLLLARCCIMLMRGNPDDPLGYLLFLPAVM